MSKKRKRKPKRKIKRKMNEPITPDENERPELIPLVDKEDIDITNWLTKHSFPILEMYYKEKFRNRISAKNLADKYETRICYCRDRGLGEMVIRIDKKWGRENGKHLKKTPRHHRESAPIDEF